MLRTGLLTHIKSSLYMCVFRPLQVATRLKSAIASKIYGYEDALSELVAEACIDVLPKNPVNFNVDNVRVVKIPGGGLSDSSVVKGMVLKRDAEGSVKHMEDGKVVVYAQGVDTASTDTKVSRSVHTHTHIPEASWIPRGLSKLGIALVHSLTSRRTAGLMRSVCMCGHLFAGYGPHQERSRVGELRAGRGGQAGGVHQEHCRRRRQGENA